MGKVGGIKGVNGEYGVLLASKKEQQGASKCRKFHCTLQSSKEIQGDIETMMLKWRGKVGRRKYDYKKVS